MGFEVFHHWLWISKFKGAILGAMNGKMHLKILYFLFPKGMANTKSCYKIKQQISWLLFVVSSECPKDNSDYVVFDKGGD